MKEMEKSEREIIVKKGIDKVFLSSTYFMIVLLIILAITLSVVFFVRSSFTGQVVGEFSFDNAESGQVIGGLFYYDLEKDGVMPANTRVKMSVNGYGRELSVGELISDRGGLSLEERDFPAKVNAVLIVNNKEVEVELKKGNEAIVPLKQGESASLKEARVRGSLIDKNYISLIKEGGLLYVSTSYVDRVQAYYSQEDIVLDLSKFELVSPLSLANVKLSFSYLGEDFAYNERVVDLSDVRKSPQQDRASGKEECGVHVICSFVGKCAEPSFESLAKNPNVVNKVRVQQCRDTICGDYFIRSVPCGEDRIPVSVKESDRFGLSPVVSDKREILDKGRSELNWDRTYDYTDIDIVSSGSLSRSLSEKTRIKVNVDGEEHSIGIYGIIMVDGKKYADIEVASEPERVLLKEGDSYEFDLNNDNLPDIEIFVKSIKENSANVQIVSTKGLFFSPLSSGEQAVSLVNKDSEIPLAHLAFNKKEDSLRVILVQSDQVFPAHCSNGVKDFDEQGVDCAGECKECKIERDERFIPLILSWSVFAVLLFALVFLLNRKFS